MNHTNTPKTIRFGIVGAGKAGALYARALGQIPHANLVAVCDPDLLHAQQLAWQFNATPYSKTQDLIRQTDAVILTAPTALHHSLGMFCLQNGLHLLVGSPLAANMDEARELIRTARSKELVLQVGRADRFNPALLQAAPFIKNPQFLTFSRLGPYDSRMAHLSVVLDKMIHDLDLLLTLVQSPVVAIDATGLSVFSNQDDVANVRLRFENGAVADLTASRVSFERTRRMQVFQHNAFIQVDFTNARVKIYKKDKPAFSSMQDIEVLYPPVEKQPAVQAELTHFIHCIHTSRTPAPSGERGFQALDLALKITERMHRFDIPKTTRPHTPKPLQMVSDAARAAQIVWDETLGQMKREK
mgnify:FL=1